MELRHARGCVCLLVMVRPVTAQPDEEASMGLSAELRMRLRLLMRQAVWADSASFDASSSQERLEMLGRTTPARSARSGGCRRRPAFHWSKAALELAALVSRRLASANLTTMGTSEPGRRVLPLCASIASSASDQRLNCTNAHPAPFAFRSAGLVCRRWCLTTVQYTYVLAAARRTLNAAGCGCAFMQPLAEGMRGG